MKLSIMVVGDHKTGKTLICNYLAGLSESLDATEYHPTQGVRILEFERQIVADPKKTKKWSKEQIDGAEYLILVELWDCGGNVEYRTCWPSFAADIHGVVFCANADSKNESELNDWQEIFSSLDPSQFVIFANRQQPVQQKAKYKTANKVLNKVPIVYTCLEQDSSAIGKEFNSFLASTYSLYLENQVLEENAILAQ